LSAEDQLELAESMIEAGEAFDLRTAKILARNPANWPRDEEE
jgi:hypothetical protein